MYIISIETKRWFCFVFICIVIVLREFWPRYQTPIDRLDGQPKFIASGSCTSWWHSDWLTQWCCSIILFVMSWGSVIGWNALRSYCRGCALCWGVRSGVVWRYRRDAQGERNLQLIAQNFWGALLRACLVWVRNKHNLQSGQNCLGLIPTANSLKGCEWGQNFSGKTMRQLWYYLHTFILHKSQSHLVSIA